MKVKMTKSKFDDLMRAVSKVNRKKKGKKEETTG